MQSVNIKFFVSAIHTAAMDMLAGSEASRTSRKPEMVADAAYAIICKDSKSVTGNFFIDEDVLRKEGITDFVQYACDPCMSIHLCPIIFNIKYLIFYLKY